MNSSELKLKVESYWNAESCGTGVALAKKFSREYFDQIEEFRYNIEPEIFAFAQFTRHYGERLLEVGVGAGTDFLQWVRAGTKAHGVDLTQEAVDHVRHRLEAYGLSAEDVRVADAEHLPYADDTFDIVYSWGVIHHSPNMEQAFSEIVRCARPGGTIKVMVYHRHSLFVFYKWVLYALLRGRPFLSFADVLYQHQESIGTKAYTVGEIKSLAAASGTDIERIDVSVSPFYDLLSTRNVLVRFGAYAMACLLGHQRCGWYMRVELRKRN